MTPDIPLSPVPDYPAAHSMDTTWFAVDRDGCVAVFSTGEEGPVPEAWEDRTFHGAIDLVQQFPVVNPPPRGEPRRRANQMRLHGVFFYGHDVATFVSPYRQTERPPIPLHVDQLPPRLRATVGRVCFHDLRFAEAPNVQPLTRLPCHTYRKPVGYICEDGRTVRPMPGQEAEYREWVRNLQTVYAEHLPAEWVFEGLSDDD